MKTLEEVTTRFSDNVLAAYDFSTAVYTGANIRITGVICSEHGAFSQYAVRFRKGFGCPDCGHKDRGKARRMNPADFFAHVSGVHNRRYDYSQAVFENMKSRITVLCPEHGEFTIVAAKHYYAKQGCGRCEAENRRERIGNYRHLASAAKIKNTGVHFFDDCSEAHEHKYVYPEQEYRGSKKTIRVICTEHGEFEQMAFKHLSGHGCPLCGAYNPKWEDDLEKHLVSLGLSVSRNSAVLDGRHIDLYVAGCKIGIELHGLRWHTEDKRGKWYHREKWQCADKKGIRLIQVFEDEWNDKFDIVISRINAVFGKSEKYMARKTEVIVLENSVAKEFLNKYHLNGGNINGIHYGLTYKNNLIAVASFGRRNAGRMISTGSVWEVLRYASSGRVIGGFSKMLKPFLELVQPDKLLSYCDLRYGNGKLYAACGFKLEGITEPDYWWVQSGKIARIPRYRTQKHKLKNHPVLKEFYSPALSEREICEAAGWRRIYGVGNQRWVLTV